MNIGNWDVVFTALDHCIKNPDEYSQDAYYRDASMAESCGDENCCPTTQCGSTRCVAGWIAWFAGYREFAATRMDHVALSPEGPYIHVEDAALTAMDLDPEKYGTDRSVFGREPNMAQIASDLFDGGLAFGEVLERIHDLAKEDGVEPTETIINAMLAEGVIDTWKAF